MKTEYIILDFWRIIHSQMEYQWCDLFFNDLYSINVKSYYEAFSVSLIYFPVLTQYKHKEPDR